MIWVQVLIGLLILTMGRRLFWIFVAAVGFVYGMDFAPLLFPAQPPEVLWLIGLAAGLLGALFAYFLEWAAVATAGFLIGGRVAVLIAASLMPGTQGFAPIAFLVGGVVGAGFVLLVFDWALILLSAGIGATLIATAIHAPVNVAPLVLGGIAVIGVLIQAASLRRSPPRPATSRRTWNR